MTFCHCGHPAEDHHLRVGRCEADTWRPELERAFGCFCFQFEPDED